MKATRIFCFGILLSSMIGFGNSAFAADSAAAPSDVFDIRSYGAIGDGKTLNTDAFAKAIAAAESAGGGRVHVGPGQFLTGTIVLKSHVTLDLDAGATILASQ